MCWFKERNYYFITEMCNTIIWFSFSELLSLNLRWINTFQFVFNIKVFATNVTQKYRPQRSKLLKFLYLELREGYVVYALLLWRNKKKAFFLQLKKQKVSWQLLNVAYIFSQQCLSSDEIINSQEFANTQHFVIDSHCWQRSLSQHNEFQ